MPKILPFILISLIWFAIGWISHEFVGQAMTLAQLPPEQKRVLKAQQILQNQQLLLQNTITPWAIPDTYSDAAIEGMLSWSQDRHGDLYGPLATERYRQGADGINGVTDIQFDVINDQIVVVDVPVDSPANMAGIQVGDILLGIDDIVFDQFVGAPEAVLLLLGPANSTYNIKIQRGNRVLTKSITRKERTYLLYQPISDEIGYLKTKYFYPGKTEVLFEELTKQSAIENLRAIIWDLRNNNGGYPSVAEEIVGYFRQPGSLLYVAEFKDGTQKEFRVDGDGRFAEMPIALLIDNSTWSTGEIVAAAMAESPFTQLIGSSTAGKGIIQDTVTLDDSHMLHFTTAKWLTPTREWIHGRGVRPDLEIEDDPLTDEDEVMEAALNYLNDVLAENIVN